MLPTPHPFVPIPTLDGIDRDPNVPAIFKHQPGLIALAFRKVVRKLQRTYWPCRDWDRDEIFGWAQLGLVRAMREFNPARLTGRTRNLAGRLITYLLVRGCHCAADEMRHAHVVGRNRYGAYCPATICTVNESASPIDHHERQPPTAAFVQELVMGALQRLTGMCRKVIELHFVEGVSQLAIARRLHISVQRVYERMAEGLRRLSMWFRANRPTI
jgi:RNA polymerase sigma factor (sigma-70 family)